MADRCRVRRPDDTYDGTVSDGRGREEVRVDVGVDSNGGTYAYDPSAVAISPGKTVRWVRVDDREGHNIVAAPDRQLGESDYEFRSGDPTIEWATSSPERSTRGNRAIPL